MSELDLLEAGFPLREGAVQSDGTILVHIIRPGIGRGRGRHYYSPDMLREHAHVFSGWKMFVNHLSDKAKKALEGLPRDLREGGGYIEESWWDDSVPADDRFEAGAVVGRVKPTRFIREMVEDVPELVETSINARATGVQVGTQKGQRVNIVEGIASEPKGSVDFVTDAGAGGKVVAMLTEGTYSEEDQHADLLDALDDDALKSYLRENRPDLVEALGEQEGNGNNDGGGKPPEEDDVAKLTPEELREALTDPENAQVLADAVAPLVESQVSDVRDEIIREAQAEHKRGNDLRDMRDHAATLIEASKLPPKFAEKAKERYDLRAGSPTPELDLFDEVDSDGKVVKSAMEKLTESVEQTIEDFRDLAASVSPTVVRGQGAHGAVVTGGDGGGDEGQKNKRVDAGTRTMLQEAGFEAEEIDEMYGEPLVGVVG